MPQDPSLLFLSYLVLLLVTSTTSNRIDNSNSNNIFKSPQQPQDTKLLPPAAVSRQLDDAVVPSFPPWWEGELVNCTQLGSLHACLIPSQGILQCWNGVCPDPDYQCTFYNYPVLIEDILGRCCDLFGGISEMLKSLTIDVFDKQESGISGSTFPHVDQLMDDLPRCEKSLVCEKATGTDKLIVDISRPNDELTFDWTPRKRCAAHVRKAGQLIYLAAVRDNQTEIAESIVNVVKYLDYRCVIWKAGNEFRGIFEDCDPANTESPTVSPTSSPTASPTSSFFTYLYLEAFDEMRYITEIELVSQGAIIQPISSIRIDPEIQNSPTISNKCVDGVSSPDLAAGVQYDPRLTCAAEIQLVGFCIQQQYSSLGISKIDSIVLHNMANSGSFVIDEPLFRNKDNVDKKTFVVNYAVPTSSFDFRKCHLVDHPSLQDPPLATDPKCVNVQSGEARTRLGGSLMFDGATEFLHLGEINEVPVMSLELKFKIIRFTSSVETLLSIANEQKELSISILDNVLHAKLLILDEFGESIKIANEASATLVRGYINSKPANGDIHAIVSFDKTSRMKLYVNGQLEGLGSAESAEIIENKKMQVRVGCDHRQTKHFAGFLQSLNIYSMKSIDAYPHKIYIYESDSDSLQSLQYAQDNFVVSGVIFTEKLQELDVGDEVSAGTIVLFGVGVLAVVCMVRLFVNGEVPILLKRNGAKIGGGDLSMKKRDMA